MCVCVWFSSSRETRSCIEVPYTVLVYRVLVQLLVLYVLQSLIARRSGDALAKNTRAWRPTMGLSRHTCNKQYLRNRLVFHDVPHPLPHQTSGAAQSGACPVIRLRMALQDDVILVSSGVRKRVATTVAAACFPDEVRISMPSPQRAMAARARSAPAPALAKAFDVITAQAPTPPSHAPGAADQGTARPMHHSTRTHALRISTDTTSGWIVKQ